METVKRLEAAQLYQRTDPEQFAFETTADLDDLEDPIGQPRAVEAMEFGTGIERKGFNVFALGPALRRTDERKLVCPFR